jgi:hypothetical protein
VIVLGARFKATQRVVATFSIAFLGVAISPRSANAKVTDGCSIPLNAVQRVNNRVTVLVEREPYDFFGGLTYDCDGFQRASDSLKDRQFYISLLDGGAGNDTQKQSRKNFQDPKVRRGLDKIYGTETRQLKGFPGEAWYRVVVKTVDGSTVPKGLKDIHVFVGNVDITVGSNQGNEKEFVALAKMIVSRLLSK